MKQNRRARKPPLQHPAADQPVVDQPTVEQPIVRKPTIKKAATGMKSKHPLEEKVNGHVPEWYPTFWPPAVEGCSILEDDVARASRAGWLASPKTPYAIPEEFAKRREKYWRVMPTAKFANANPHNQSKIFAFSIAIAPHLATHITTQDDSTATCDAGLPGQLWKQVATYHGDDLEHSDGFERTKLYLHQFGMQFVVDQLEGRAPTVISRHEPVDNGFAVPLFEDVDKVDYGEEKLVDLDAQDWDPRYFQRRTGEPEELRYQNEPLGWRYSGPGVRQQRGAFIFVVPTTAAAQQGEAEGDGKPLQWQQILPTERDFVELFTDSDVWECYEHGLVFLLPRYGDPCESDACGEHFLNPSVIYRTDEHGSKSWLTDGTRGADAAEYYTEPFVLRDLRLWHGHDEHRPLALPAEPLGIVGMYSKNVSFGLADDVAATIFPAAALKVDTLVGRTTGTPRTQQHTAATLTTLTHDANITFDGVDAGLYAPPADSSEQFDWPVQPVRRRVAFIYAVMSFVSELITLDTVQRYLFKDKVDLQAMSNLERRELLMSVWQGTTVGSYSRLDIASSDWRTRLPCVLALHETMSVWPHVELLNVGTIECEEQLVLLEKNVWQQFALAYCDFFSRKPPCPPVLDVDADAGSPSAVVSDAARPAKASSEAIPAALAPA